VLALESRLYTLFCELLLAMLSLSSLLLALQARQ
jgi:hypothetical protein